jgi:hypothetical protein
MATVKSFNTSYSLVGPAVTITGNLTVLGNTTTVTSNNITLTDNIIILNNGETAAGVSKGNAGILINRGSLIAAQLLWNQLAGNVWQITDNNGNFGNILTNPLTSNISTSTFAISGTPNVVFSSNLQLNNVDTAPASAITNATLVYGATPGGGTSGLYVLNGSAANEELVTKRRAFGFSLIL